MARTTVHRLNSCIENRLVGGGIDGRNCKNSGRKSGTTDQQAPDKGSDLELNFKNLTLEVAGFKAKLNGSIVLNILYVSEK